MPEDEQPPAWLTEKGRESWRRRRELEQRRLARLEELKPEYEHAHEAWERLREHYRGNKAADAVLDGHEPQLYEGGGWAIHSPAIFCDACGVHEEGSWSGLWPCWTYETLAGLVDG